MLRVLEPAPGTADELAAETRIPIADVDAALSDLRDAGHARELDQGRWKAERRGGPP